MSLHQSSAERDIGDAGTACVRSPWPQAALGLAALAALGWLPLVAFLLPLFA